MRGSDFSFTSIMASGASGGGIGLTELLSILPKSFPLSFLALLHHTDERDERDDRLAGCTRRSGTIKSVGFSTCMCQTLDESERDYLWFTQSLIWGGEGARGRRRETIATVTARLEGSDNSFVCGRCRCPSRKSNYIVDYRTCKAVGGRSGDGRWARLPIGQL